MNTPETARSLAAGVVGSAPASAVVASRPSQSPKLDRPSAIHSRRNGVIARTARTSWSGASGAASFAVGGRALVLASTTSAAYVRPPTTGGGRCAACCHVHRTLTRWTRTSLRGRRRRLRSRLLRRGLLRRLARGLLGRTASALIGEQLGGALEGDRLRVVVLAQGRVDVAVGDVRAEPALLDEHRLPGRRVGTELAQRGLGLAAAALGLGVDLQRVVERQVEQLGLRGQRARVRALLQVGPVAPVLRGDLLTGRGIGADQPRQ